MSLIAPDRARRFAEDWIDAWNGHDLDRVLAHYADGVEFSSPLIVNFGGESSGILKGKPAIRDYWRKGLERIPDLHFELIDVLTGVDRITLYYRGHRGMVAECFMFGTDGRVIHASACYG